MSAVSNLLRIRPGEGRTVTSVVALMFVASAGATIGESGVNALFFDKVGPHALPVMYLLQGATGLIAMLVLTGSLARFDRRRAYVVMPALVAAIVVLERAIVASGFGWMYRVLWLTVAVAQLLQSVYLWGTAGAVTDTRRAKRLFPLFGSGSILGAVVGGILTRPLAGFIGVGNLLLVWAGCLLGAGLLGASVLGVRGRERVRTRARRRSSALHDLGEALSFVRRSPLLIWMTAAGVLFSVLFYSLFLPFAQAATARYPDPKALAGFFGVFGAAVTVIAFLISIFLANRLLAWLGAAVVILLLPLLYGGAFGALLVSSAFATLVAVRAGAMVWLQGVASPGWETLINVTPETRRDQVRAFLSGGPSQTGTAIAGIITLVGQQALSAKQLSLIGLVVAALTIGVAWRIRRSYTGALVDALRAGRPSVFGGRPVEGTPVVLELDATAVALAMQASLDPDVRIRRLGVEMLSAAGEDPRAKAALQESFTDEDAMVRAIAIRALSDAGALDSSRLGVGLDDEDVTVRLAAIDAFRNGSRDPSLTDRLRALAAGPDASVASAACVAMFEGSSRTEALEQLGRLLSDDDSGVRAEVVRRLGFARADDSETLVRPLLDDPSPAVRAEALRALAAAAPDAAVGSALRFLEEGDASLHDAALDVLGGSDIGERASEIDRLAQERGAMARRDLALASAIPTDGGSTTLLRTALLERGRSNALLALSALSLLSRNREAMRVALENLRAGEPGQLANALETLEATEHRSLATPLFPLWEPTARTNAVADDWIDLVAQDQDPLIRSCVELVQTTEQGGGTVSRSRTSMSPMERVLALRKIPLFGGLSTADLRRLADISQERTFSDGEVISSEGEIGDELHLVLDGTVIVQRDTGSAVARRGPGEVVGEMSIITRKPRVASLVAEGEVRTMRIGQREFESLIRERPDVSLALMRVLAERLGAFTVAEAGPR